METTVGDVTFLKPNLTIEPNERSPDSERPTPTSGMRSTSGWLDFGKPAFGLVSSLEIGLLLSVRRPNSLILET